MTDVPHTNKRFEPARRVLLLDDDRFLLDMYSLKFTKSGFVVQTCMSADEALDTLRGGFVPNAVVFDLIMPQKDGHEFLRAIKDEHLAEGAVLIALTNQTTDRDKLEAEGLEADAFITKATMVPSEVVNTVSDAISGKQGA